MKKLTLAILLMSTTAPVFADSKFSAELSLGQANYQINIGDINVDLGDSTSFGIKGTYKFTPNFAIDLGYQNLAEAEKTTFGNTSKMSGSQINLGVKGIMPFDNGLSVSGVLGISQLSLDMNDISDDGSDFYFGVGGYYSFTSQFFMGMEYTLFGYSFGDTDEDSSIDVDVLTLNVGMNF